MMFLDKLAKISLFLALSPFLMGFTSHQDLDLGRWHGYGALQASTSLCVETNSDLSRLKLSGGHHQGKFTLSSGNQHLPLEVSLISRGGKRTIQPHESFRLFNTRNSEICSIGIPLSLSILIRPEHLNKISSGSYQGQLIVTVLPE